MKIRWSPPTLQKSVVRNYARRRINKFFAPFKPANIQKLLDTDKDISAFIPAHKLAEWKEKAPGYDWAAEMFTDEDLVALIPQWIRDIVAQHPNGDRWLKRQIATVHSFFGQ